MSSVKKSEIILTYFIKETNESEIKIAYAIVLIVDLEGYSMSQYTSNLRKYS